MNNKTSAPAQPKTNGKDHDENQGEGDKRSAKRFNREQKAFVQSARGQDAIEQASDVAPQDQAKLLQAEREGAARAKGKDPAVTRRHAAPEHADPQGSKKGL